MKRLSFFLALLGVAMFMWRCGGQQTWPAGRWIDLTYSFSEESVYWPTAKSFSLEVVSAQITPQGYYYAANNFAAAEHGGTHLDAPRHFAEGHMTADQLPVDRLIGPGILIDVSEKAGADRDYRVSVEDFTSWETEHGRIPDGSIVLLRTGFGKYYPDREKYMGTAERGAAAVAKLHFPGLHPDAARWLADNRKINAIGLDTPSIDYGQSTMFESHQILFAQNIPAFENVANLEQLPETGFMIFALPMKIKGGSGGPLRIVAFVPKG